MTKQLIGIASSDWHCRALGRSPFGRMPGLCGDDECALQQLGRLVVEHRPKFLIGAGDLCDSNRHASSEIRALRELLTVVSKCETAFYFVQGQHEMADPPLISACYPEAIYVGDNKIFTIPGTALTITGCDYLPSGREDYVSTLQGAELFVSHQLWKNSEWMGERFGSYWLDSFPSCRLLVSGDFHKSQSFVLPSGTTVLSPGALYQQKINEPGEHFVWAVYDDLSVAPIQLKSRQIHRVTVTGEDNLADIQQYLDAALYISNAVDFPAEIAKPLIRVDLLNTQVKLRRDIEAIVGDKAFLAVEPFVVAAEEVLIEQSHRQAVVASAGLAGCIPEFCGGDQELEFAAVEFCKSPTPVETLAARRNAFFGVTT